MPSTGLLIVCFLLMLSVKSGKIPFSKPRGLLCSSRADIHMSCNCGQVLWHLLDASTCKGKVSVNLPSRPCFPGVQGTPCRYPLLHLAAESPYQRGEGAEMGWLQAVFGKVPGLTRPVKC